MCSLHGVSTHRYTYCVHRYTYCVPIGMHISYVIYDICIPIYIYIYIYILTDITQQRITLNKCDDESVVYDVI